MTNECDGRLRRDGSRGVKLDGASQLSLVEKIEAGHGQNVDSYDPSMDLGRVDMKMEKPQVPIEKLKFTITTSGKTGKLQLEWENNIASVSIRAK